MRSLHTLDSQFPPMDSLVITAPPNSPLFPIKACSPCLFSVFAMVTHLCISLIVISLLVPNKLSFAGKIAGQYIFLNKFIYLFYLFLAALGLHCVQAFSSCSERGLLFVVVRVLLIALASLVAEHGL